MAIPTLDGVDLRGCSNIHAGKSANIIPLTLPTGDSDDTEVFDMLGVVKIISISGTFSGGSVAATKAFVDAIEALEDGNQTVIDFISDQTGTISCMVMDVDSDWEVPGFKVEYEIKIVQGKA